ncbi:MAG: hypothetical protein ACJAY8_001292 [Sphingobacteriales bacterium]|jgi:hypothetical protein
MTHFPKIKYVFGLGLFLVLLFCSSSLSAQKDSSTVKIEKLHSPKKATILSAVVPGLGQIYNRKFWKLPLVYGAIGTSIYFIHENKRLWIESKQQYLVLLNTDGKTAEQSTDMEQLKNDKDYYRRMHEISWFALSGSYILNILDACVDAHLFYFDVSEDISLHWQPVANPNYAGISLRLTRK